MADIPPILWGILVGFIFVAANAAYETRTLPEFWDKFRDGIGAKGLRQRSPFLYWCGVAIGCLIATGLLYGLLTDG